MAFYSLWSEIKNQQMKDIHGFSSNDYSIRRRMHIFLFFFSFRLLTGHLIVLKANHFQHPKSKHQRLWLLPGELLSAKVTVTGSGLVNWTLQTQLPVKDTVIITLFLRQTKRQHLQLGEKCTYLTMTPGLRSKFFCTICSSSSSSLLDVP